MVADDTTNPWTDYHADIIMNHLLSPYYWPDSIINNNNNNGLNIKPFGYGYIHAEQPMYSTKYRYDKELSDGNFIEYFISPSYSLYITQYRFTFKTWPNDSYYYALRCVKNE